MKISKRKWALGAAGVAVVAAVATTTAASSADSGDNANTVAAYFTDAGSLIAGNTVRANGVIVGDVSSVTLDHGLARVDMALDPKILPLHADAGAKIRPISLLGEQYVDLDSGSPGAPVMVAPAQIPVTRTSQSVDVQAVLNTLDTPTSTALAALLTTLGEGFEGNGANVAGAIKALQPAMTQANDLTSVLNQQNALLDTLIEQAAPVAQSIAGNDGHTVDQLVQAADQTLGSVAANRAMLSNAVAQLPQTLQDARHLLQQLGGVADATTPALQSAKPVTDNLTAISGELRSFTDAGSPALASLEPVLDRANALLDQARPVVSDLRAGAGDLRAVAANARPLGTAVEDNLDNLLNFVTGWAMATAGYDAIGHFFRAQVPIDSNTIKQIAPDLVPAQLLGGATAPAPSTGSPAAPSAPPLPLALPDLPLGLGGSQPPADPGSATGLTQQQENSLQSLIFGGL